MPKPPGRTISGPVGRHRLLQQFLPLSRKRPVHLSSDLLNVSMLMRRYRAMSTLLAPIPAICLTLARSSSVGSWGGRPLPRFSSTNMAKWGIIAYADFQNGFEHTRPAESLAPFWRADGAHFDLTSLRPCHGR